MSRPKIKICIGSSCYSRGNAKNVEAAEKFLDEHGLKDNVDVELEGCLCLGHCSEGPIVQIGDRIYTNVSGGMIVEILSKLFPSDPASAGKTTD